MNAICAYSRDVIESRLSAPVRVNRKSSVSSGAMVMKRADPSVGGLFFLQTDNRN